MAPPSPAVARPLKRARLPPFFSSSRIHREPFSSGFQNLFSASNQPSISSESSASCSSCCNYADSASSGLRKTAGNGSKSSPSTARGVLGAQALGAATQEDASAVIAEGEDSSDATSCSFSEAIAASAEEGIIDGEAQSSYSAIRKLPQKGRFGNAAKGQAADADVIPSSFQILQDWQGEGICGDLSGGLSLEFDPDTVFHNFLDGTASLDISSLGDCCVDEEDVYAACCSPESTSVFLNDLDSDGNAFLNDVLDQEWIIAGGV